MIKVIVRYKDKQIQEVKVSGHANSAEYGKDLVCAGVSTVCSGIANTLVTYRFLDDNMGTIDYQEGFVRIKVNQFDEKIQVVLETFVISLMTIEESYSKYIKITKMEV